MKRIISVFLAFAMLFSLAACNSQNGNEPTTASPPVIEAESFEKQFTDENGKTVFSLKVTLPQISDFANNEIKDRINKKAKGIFDNACEFAQNNIENASEFMKNHNSDKPWTKAVTFETTLLTPDYACFVIKDAFSYYGGEATPTRTTLCYDVKTGEECTLDTFTTTPDDVEGCFESFVDDIVRPVFVDRYDFPQFVDDAVLERLDEIIHYDNFYLTENGISFYIDGLDISPQLPDTISFIHFEWGEISAYYMLP